MRTFQNRFFAPLHPGPHGNVPAAVVSPPMSMFTLPMPRAKRRHETRRSFKLCAPERNREINAALSTACLYIMPCASSPPPSAVVHTDDTIIRTYVREYCLAVRERICSSMLMMIMMMMMMMMMIQLDENGADLAECERRLRVGSRSAGLLSSVVAKANQPTEEGRQTPAVIPIGVFGSTAPFGSIW